jgi:Fe-S oxidoreductase
MDANLILALIGLLMVTAIFGSAFRIAARGGHADAWAPVGSMLAPLFSGLSPNTAATGSNTMWWTHMLGVFFFICYLPYSKHAHLIVSPFNVFFTNLRPVGNLAMPGVPEDYSAGAASWQQFTWRQLLGGFACAECGRCDRSCPAQNSGYALSPQDIMHKIKVHFLETAVDKKPGGNPTAENEVTLAGGQIQSKEVWACTTCLACMECCAVWNEQVPVIVQMRRHLVGQGAVDRGVQDVLDRMNRYGNSFGKSDRMRARWVQNGKLKIKDARKEPVDYVWFVGDYASYDPRCEDITVKTARILQQTGLDFGLLYEGERNSGNDVRRIGEEGLFEVLHDKNVQAMAKVQWKNGAPAILTTDPHSYNTLKNEYRWENSIRVLHYTELLDQLMSEGRLKVARKLNMRATYHDPCYLGRYNGVYDPPRRILERLGITLVEMPRNRGRSYCCGAGGGRIWMEDAEKVKERPSENRIREAVSLPNVATFIVACPKDIAMFRDAVKTTGQEEKMQVKDIADLVWEAMAPEESQLAS